MGTHVLDYIKGLCENGEPPFEWALTPDYTEVLCDALGLGGEYKKAQITFENLPHYIDQQRIIGETDDLRVITKICAHPKFIPDMLNIEFLAQIMDSPDFGKIMQDENAKRKISAQYSESIAHLQHEDAEPVVMQSESYMTLAEHCPDVNKKRELLQTIQDKINEVKEAAENIREVRNLLKFHAIRYNENRLKRNLRFVLENFIAVWGKNMGELLAETYRAMYDGGKNDDEKQLILDGVVIAFDAKMMALRRAWGIKDDEAPHNFMVEV
jgi:uncharacterized protein (UPF0147 family)